MVQLLQNVHLPHDRVLHVPQRLGRPFMDHLDGEATLHAP